MFEEPIYTKNMRNFLPLPHVQAYFHLAYVFKTHVFDEGL